MSPLGLFWPSLNFIMVIMKNIFCTYWAGRTRLELFWTILASQCSSSSTDSTCRLLKAKPRSSSYAASASTCHRNSSPIGRLALLRITSALTCPSKGVTSQTGKIRSWRQFFFFYFIIFFFFFTSPDSRRIWTRTQKTYVVNLHAGYFFLHFCIWTFFFFNFHFWFIVHGPCEKEDVLKHLCFSLIKCELMGLWHTESNVSESTRYYLFWWSSHLHWSYPLKFRELDYSIEGETWM